MLCAEPRSRPLLVVTRSGTPSPLDGIARDAGLELLWLPVTASRIRALARARLRRLVRSQRYDWIAVTSGRAVSSVADAWRPLGRRAHRSGLPQVAAVGPATAKQLRMRGVPVTLEGPGPGGAALADAILKSEPLRRLRVIWPRASGAAPTLAQVLRSRRVAVADIALYDTAAINAHGVEALDRALLATRVGAICFSAPSAVGHVFRRLSPAARSAIGSVPIGSFGPSTTSALRALAVTAIIEVNRGAATDRVRHFIDALAARHRRLR